MKKKINNNFTKILLLLALGLAGVESASAGVGADLAAEATLMETEIGLLVPGAVSVVGLILVAVVSINAARRLFK